MLSEEDKALLIKNAKAITGTPALAGTETAKSEQSEPLWDAETVGLARGMAQAAGVCVFVIRTLCTHSRPMSSA